MSSGKVLTSDDVQLAFAMTKMLLYKLSTKKQRNKFSEGCDRLDSQVDR
jgi:hypothetical protein